jgi:hypothetical protein
MIVTAINKMSHGKTLAVSWSGVLTQTTLLPKDATTLDRNLARTEEFIRSLGTPAADDGRNTKVWKSVGGKVISSYVESMTYPPAAARASGEQLGAFIRKQLNKPAAELNSWTVAFVSNTKAGPELMREVAGHSVGLVVRSPESQDDGSISLKKANMLSPADEAWDFKVNKDGSAPVFDKAWCDAVSGKRDLEDDVEWLREQVGRRSEDVAFDLTLRWQQCSPPKLRKPPKGETSRPNGRVLRVLRPGSEGLLLIYPIVRPGAVIQEEPARVEESTGLDPKDGPMIGIALSFPTSQTTLGVEYKVNKVWGTEIQEDDAYED